MIFRRFLGMGLAVLVAVAGLTACSDTSKPTEAPPASDDTADASGYYCGMLLSEHSGPKGQVHLSSQKNPIWFSSVHDTIVFMRLPEEPRDITAVYVHDMGGDQDWEAPANVWTEARQAWFVIDSDRRGGMGTPEAVPFSSRDDADAFVDRHGGKVMQLADIPDDYFSGLVEGHGPEHDMHDGHDGHGDHADQGDSRGHDDHDGHNAH